MDALFALLLLLLALVVVSAPILSLFALRRTRGVADLEGRVRWLESELRRVHERLAPTPGPRAEPARKPIPAHLGKPRPEPSPAEPAPPTPTPAPTVSTAPAREPAAAGAGVREREDFPFEVGPRGRSLRLPEIEWERLLGIRGAALLGGIALALAGLLLFRHGIQQGWFGPELRVVSGALLGIACLASKELLMRRGYRVVSEVLAGAGAIVLHGTAWAAFQRYGLIGQTAAFAWMAATTAACCTLAVRHQSQLIALFGLVGGFATPLLVGQGEDQPFKLFGYVLILDLGLLAIGRRMRWPSLAFFGVLGTGIWQALWIGLHMDGERALLGLGILATFAMVFIALGAMAPRDDGRTWRLSSYTGMALPILYALYFARSVEFAPDVYGLAGLLAILGVGAAWMARRQGTPELPLATSLGSAGVLWAWLSAQPLGAAVLWQFGGAALVLGGVQLGFAELAGRAAQERADARWPRRPGVPALALSLTVLLALALTSCVADGSVPFVPVWVLAGAALLVTWRAAALAELAPVVPAGALALGLTHAAFAVRESFTANDFYPGDAAFVIVALVAAAALFGLTWLPSRGASRRWAPLAPLAFALPVIAQFARAEMLEPTLHLGAVLGLGTLGALAAARSRVGLAYALLVAAVAGSSNAWSEAAALDERLFARAAEGLAWQLGSVAALALAPFALLRDTRDRKLIWWLAAASTLLWFSPPTIQLFEARWPDGGRGLVPLALGLVSAVGALLAHISWSGAAAGQKTAKTCFLAAMSVGVCSALPFEIDIAWGVVATALTGAAWTFFGRRLGAERLTTAGAAALATAGVVTCALALPMGYFRTSEALLWNPFGYAFAAPTACLALGLYLLRGWGDKVAAARILGLLLPLVVFGWLNTIVLNAFDEGTHVTFQHGDMRRDLVQSIVWVAYSLALLGLGTARRISGLRWLSLAFLLATIGKVFLYDLSELEGLYRVFSMFGLALSLLFVSLLYQRFVFGHEREPDAES